MFSLQFVKQSLAAFGIKDLAIVFDAANSQIVATYTFAGKKATKTLLFKEIEAAFTHSTEGVQDTPENQKSDKPDVG